MPRWKWVYFSSYCGVYRACQGGGGLEGHYEKEREPLLSIFVGNVLGVIEAGKVQSPMGR